MKGKPAKKKLAEKPSTVVGRSLQSVQLLKKAAAGEQRVSPVTKDSLGKSGEGDPEQIKNFSPPPALPLLVFSSLLARVRILRRLAAKQKGEEIEI